MLDLNKRLDEAFSELFEADDLASFRRRRNLRRAIPILKSQQAQAKQAQQAQAQQAQAQQAQAQQAQAQHSDETLRLNMEQYEQFQQYKMQLNNAIGVIVKTIPDLKDTIMQMRDSLFRTAISNVFLGINEELTVEQATILQQAWRDIFSSTEGMLSLVGRDNHIGLNIINFRNTIKQTLLGLKAKK